MNLIAAGFVDTPLANTALTGASYDIDGGQQLLARGVSDGPVDLGPAPS